MLRELLARTTGRLAHTLTRADFDYPSLNEFMAEVFNEVMHGRGVVVLSGLDFSPSLDELARIHWGLGCHLGTGAPQNSRGDYLCEVKFDEANGEKRGYARRIELYPHTDFHEILGLACFSRAAGGGESGFVSSLAVHNVLLKEHPEVLGPLYEGAFEAIPGAERVSPEKAPVFCNVEHTVSCFFHHYFHERAAILLGAEVPAPLVAAKEVVSRIALRPELRVSFTLDAGEIVFWNNFTLLHSRSAFVDAPDHSRLLLRCWLNVPNGRPVHRSFLERSRHLDRAHASGVAAIDYNLI